MLFINSKIRIMKIIKQAFINFPELYLVALAILVGYTPPFTFNPFLIGIAAIVILQIIFRNKISGIILGIAFMLANIYMLLALMSESSKYVQFNDST